MKKQKQFSKAPAASCVINNGFSQLPVDLCLRDRGGEGKGEGGLRENEVLLDGRRGGEGRY